MMMQQSVYTKVCLNMNAATVVSANVRKNKPPKGLVQMMVVTEAQFTRMEFVSGEENKIYIMDTKRMIVL
jgi:CRISPR-associated protein Cas2